MVKTIKINCPHCENKSELFLSMNPTLIVLNCPKCWTPLLLDKDGVHAVSKKEIKEMVEQSIRVKKTDTMLMPDPSECFHSCKKEYLTRGASSEVSFHGSKPGRIVHRDSITMDDVFDMRIELAQCEDVEEFIQRI
jgi:ribosomal protein S27E